ncbi:MAG: sigma 54-interacting transcriptional regulator [Nannocystaceae bacterium]
MKPRLRLGRAEPRDPDHSAEESEPLVEETELDAFIATRMLRRDGDGLYDRIGSVTLRVMTGPNAGHSQTFFGDRIGGGRGVANHLVLEDQAASQTHFELVLGTETVTLRDLESTNGTWLGPIQIREIVIPEKTVFTVGETDIELARVKRLRVPASRADEFGRLRGHSSTMRELFTLLSRISETDLDFLVQGEPGTGKGTAVDAVHRASSRNRGPLVVFDCSSEPGGDEIHRALLGCQEGPTAPFPSGAGGGTLLLRRVECLPIRVQAQILAALTQRDRARQRSPLARRGDIRLVLSSHIDLRTLVSEGLFHEDLAQRISEVLVRMPPLRERPDDAVFLLEHALVDLAPERSFRLTPDAIRMMSVYSFPGNVGELLMVARRIVDTVDGEEVNRRQLGLGLRPPGIFDDLVELDLAEARSIFTSRYYAALQERFHGQPAEIATHASVSMATVRRALPHLFGGYRK